MPRAIPLNRLPAVCELHAALALADAPSSPRDLFS